MIKLCRKKLNKGVLLYIHINFSVSLSLALAVFVSGIESATSYSVRGNSVTFIYFYIPHSLFCAVDVHSCSNTAALFVSLCVLLDVGRGHCALYVGG